MNPINSHKDYTVDLLLSAKLEVELIEVIYLLRNQPENPDTKKKAIDLLTKSVEDNLDHYFTKPAAELKLSRLGTTALNMGLSTINKLTHSVGHKILKKADKEQMRAISDFLEINLLKHSKVS